MMRLKMQKPVDVAKCFVSLDGFEVIVGKEGKKESFDFEVMAGGVDKEDPTVIEWDMRGEYDPTTDEEDSNLKEYVSQITAISKLHLYIDESIYENQPVEIEKFWLEDSGEGEMPEVPKSSEYVRCIGKCIPRTDADEWSIEYHFTKAALKGCRFDVEDM
jgi:hypothetical protein